MKKQLLALLTSSLFIFTSLYSEIQEIQSVEEILPFVEEDSIVLFNIAEVLTDSSISLGSQAWRKYVKAKQAGWNKARDFDLHDVLTLYAFKKIPHKSVEDSTPELIRKLQLQGIEVMALTSRGKSEWYSTPVSGIDRLTIDVLANIGIDLTVMHIPEHPLAMESLFGNYYSNGIIFACHREKGELMKEILLAGEHFPKKILLIDDKLDSLEEMESQLKTLNIPFSGFWYTKTKNDHADFEPIVSTIQLEKLIFKNRIITDSEAKSLADGIDDPDLYFYRLLDKIDFDSLSSAQ